MSKLTSVDWWMNRTPKQLARKERIEASLAWMDRGPEAGKKLQKLGWSLVLYATVPLIILVVTFPLGIVLAPLSAWGIYRMRNRKP